MIHTELSLADRETLAEFLGVSLQALSELRDDLGEEQFWHFVCTELRNAFEGLVCETLGMEVDDPELVAWLPTPADDDAIIEFVGEKAARLRAVWHRRSLPPADLPRGRIVVRARPRERRARRTARTVGSRGDPSEPDPDLAPAAWRAA